MFQIAIFLVHAHASLFFGSSFVTINVTISVSALSSPTMKMGVSENVVYPIVPNGFADHEIPF